MFPVKPLRLPGSHWQVVMPKTQISRFHIHDELSAPEGSLPVLKGALSSAGQLPNFLGVLAGSPAALRGYARFRSELRNGTLKQPTLERIALAIAEHFRSEPGLAIHQRTARQAGLGIDEVALAREGGWSDEQLLEAIAVVTLESFTAMVNVAGEVPVDGSFEETRVLRAA